MKYQVYSIYDSKTKIYNTPFYAQTHGEAERNFKGAVNAPDGLVSTYPEDYDLFNLGTYDDNTGLMEALQTPLHIIKATALKNDK